MGLQQGGEQSFHRAGQAAVQHHRHRPGPGRIGVGQAEPGWLVEVDLDGRQGERAAVGPGQLPVDLRPVERRLARGRGVRHPGRVQGLAQQPFGLLPRGVVTGVPAAGAAQGQLVGRHPQAQCPVGPAHQLEHGGDLRADPVERAEDVGVVELDRPDPAQAAEHPGALGPVHAAELGDPQRQVPVRALPRPEDQRVVRAQAGPQHQRVAVGAAHRHRREHVVGEVLPVPGQLVHLPFAQHRGVHVPVAGAAFELAQVGLDLVAGGGAGRQPERQPGADQRVGVEDVELAPELVVVHGHRCLLVSGAPGHRPGAARRPRADARGRLVAVRSAQRPRREVPAWS